MNLKENFSKKKNLLTKKENLYFVFLVIIIFILDRLTKNKIIDDLNDSTYFFNNFINFDLIWNTGIGFGLMSSDSSIIYSSTTILIGLIILILSYVFLSFETLDKFIFSIIIGGAFGNFYDRIFYNAVPDFIDLHYNDLHWFTFNVADIFVSLGLIAFIVRDFFVKR
jgi:signal peptidase II